MKKGKKFIIGIVLLAIGVVGLFGLFGNTDDKAALAVGCVLLISAGAVLVVLDMKFPDKNDSGSDRKKSKVYVFVTKTGKKYHSSPSCSALNGGGYRMEINKARKGGYTPCEKCQYDYLK